LATRPNVNGGTGPSAGPLEGIAVESTGQYAYAVNIGDQTVSEYAVQPNGTLATNGTLPLPSNPDISAVSQIAITLWDKKPCAYAPDGGLAVLYEMAIDPSTGTLSYVGNVAALNDAYGIAVHPNQKFIYVTASTVNAAVVSPMILVYAPSFDQKVPSCAVALTSEVSVPVNSEPLGIAVEPTGQYAYVANIGNGTVGEFSIDSATGALTPIGQVDSETPANPQSQPFCAVTTH